MDQKNRQLTEEDRQLLESLREDERKQYIELFQQFSVISVLSFIFAAIAYVGTRDIYPYSAPPYGGVEFYQLVSYVLVIMVAVPTTLAALYGFKAATASISTKQKDTED